MTHTINGSACRNSTRLRASLLLTAAVTMGLVSISSAATKSVSPSIINDLRNGGYVIYIRHASTESDYADQVNADPKNCSTQRTLSEKGWREASLIGASLDVLSVPIGAVYSSQYCRAWQTAEIAFGRSVKLEELNFEPSEEYSEAQISAMRNRVLPLLSVEPAPGTNTVFVGHDDPFEAVTGVYPEPQGVTYILKRTQIGGIEIVGSVAPDDWANYLFYR